MRQRLSGNWGCADDEWLAVGNREFLIFSAVPQLHIVPANDIHDDEVARRLVAGNGPKSAAGRSECHTVADAQLAEEQPLLARCWSWVTHGRPVAARREHNGAANGDYEDATAAIRLQSLSTLRHAVVQSGQFPRVLSSAIRRARWNGASRS